jgi:hypothetical protein
MTIDEVVSNLKSRLDSDQVFSNHREVVFVAHSLGGLIVQRLLLTHRELAKQVPLIYFYSTPETGAQVARLAHLFSHDPLIKEMFAVESNDYLLNLENEWRSAGFNIHRYCAYEKQPLHGVLVVDRLTGTRNCERTVAINENHETIVKPCDRSADSYIALRNAIRDNPVQPAKISSTTVTEIRKWASYQKVDCNRTNAQTLTASVPLDTQHGEQVVSMSASLEDADNIQGQKGPSLTPLIGNTTVVTYGFDGKNKDAFGNCPGGGHATIVVTFVVQKQVAIAGNQPANPHSALSPINGETKPPTRTVPLAARYENISILREPNHRKAALLIWREDGGQTSGIEKELADFLKAKHTEPVQSFFTPEFVRGGHAMELFSGKWAIARQLELEKHVDYVVIGVAKTTFTPSAEFSGLITANLEIDLKCLDAAALRVSANQNIAVTGAGYTEAAALATSLEHARGELQIFVREMN